MTSTPGRRVDDRQHPILHVWAGSSPEIRDLSAEWLLTRYRPGRCAERRPFWGVPGLFGFDHGAYRRCGTTSDVQGRKAPGARDLIAVSLAGHLQVAVQQHPHPGRPDRMSHTDETAARIHRQVALTGGDAAVDRVAAAPGLGEAEVTMAMYCEMVKQSWVSMPSR